MGYRRWAVGEQLAWLRDHANAFRKAQKERTVDTFMSTTFQQYFDTFYPGVTVPKEAIEEAQKGKQGSGADTASAAREGPGEDDGQIDVFARAKQLRYWFYNHRVGKPGAGADEGSGMFNFAPKKPTKRHLYQVYWHLNKDKVNAEAKTRFAAYLKDLSEKGEDLSLPEGTLPAAKKKEWLSFAVESAKHLFEKESDEVKKKVVEVHETMSIEHIGLEMFTERESDVDADEQTKRAIEIQNGINDLPKVLKNVLEEIEKKLGWVGTIVVGGPSPDTGKLMAMIAHQGCTLNLGYNFAEASEAWQPLEESFNKFLASCFTPEARKKLTDTYNRTAIPSLRTHTPAGDDSAPPHQHTDVPRIAVPTNPANTLDSDPGPSTTATATSSTNLNAPSTETPRDVTDKRTATDAQPAAHKEQEDEEEEDEEDGEDEEDYDQMICRRRAELKAHFASMGVKQAADAFNNGIASAKKPRTRKKAPAPTEKPSSTRPQTRSVSAATTTLPAPSVHAPLQPPADPSAGASGEPQAGPSGATSSAKITTPQAITDGAHLAQAPSLTPSFSPPPSSAQPVPSAIPSTVPPLPPPATAPSVLPLNVVTVTAQLPLAPTQPLLLPDSSKPPPLPPVGTPALPPTVESSTVTNGGGALTIPKDDLSAIAPPLPTSATLDFAPLTGKLSSPDTTRQDTSGAVFDRIDENAPQYVKDALKYFALIEGGGPEFVELVELWQRFEMDRHYPGGQRPDHRLSTENRPSEIPEWMKVGRSYENLPPIEPKTFGPTWKGWWISLQPSCRVDADTPWPLLRVEPIDPIEWDSLWRAGPNGFFLVILSLAWWLWAVSENEEAEAEDGVTITDVLDAISDVVWVLRLTAAPQQAQSSSQLAGGQKRPLESGSSAAAKRIRSK